VALSGGNNASRWVEPNTESYECPKFSTTNSYIRSPHSGIFDSTLELLQIILVVVVVIIIIVIAIMAIIHSSEEPAFFSVRSDVIRREDLQYLKISKYSFAPCIQATRYIQSDLYF
jgi:lipopolysaccharide/colanic/teichoic acid biosynthesis glycosyltransferase